MEIFKNIMNYIIYCIHFSLSNLYYEFAYIRTLMLHLKLGSLKCRDLNILSILLIILFFFFFAYLNINIKKERKIFQFCSIKSTDSLSTYIVAGNIKYTTILLTLKYTNNFQNYYAYLFIYFVV